MKISQRLVNHFEKSLDNPFISGAVAALFASNAFYSFKGKNYIPGGIYAAIALYIGLEGYFSNRKRNQRIASLEAEKKSLEREVRKYQ